MSISNLCRNVAVACTSLETGTPSNIHFKQKRHSIQPHIQATLNFRQLNSADSPCLCNRESPNDIFNTLWTRIWTSIPFVSTHVPFYNLGMILSACFVTSKSKILRHMLFWSLITPWSWCSHHEPRLALRTLPFSPLPGGKTSSSDNEYCPNSWMCLCAFGRDGYKAASCCCQCKQKEEDCWE